jgi:hypothetical protein
MEIHISQEICIQIQADSLYKCRSRQKGLWDQVFIHRNDTKKLIKTLSFKAEYFNFVIQESKESDF